MSKDMIEFAKERFDEVAGLRYRKTAIGAMQFESYLASLSRDSCVSILKTEYGIETHVCAAAIGADREKSPSFAEELAAFA